MDDDRSPPRRSRRPQKPLDPARLEDMALAYVARFSTTAVKFERYLTRKLRERGWDGEEEAPIAATVARYVELGYIDDESYARMKSGSLLRRGYGARRVRQALGDSRLAERLAYAPDAVAPAQQAAGLHPRIARVIDVAELDVPLDRGGDRRFLLALPPSFA